METTQVSINKWIVKENVELIYTYYSLLFSFRMYEYSDTCYSMNGHWGHYDEWNKPVTKDKYYVIPHMWDT